ncbi:unnamed protein product [Calypogeia fissa]
MGFASFSAATPVLHIHNSIHNSVHRSSSAFPISITPLMEPKQDEKMAPTTNTKQKKKKGDCVFIVNPNGANGRTGSKWKKLFPKLSVQLAEDYNLAERLTTGPNHAVQLTREAIQDGAAAVVAVGGDGTLHEVVNGFFQGGKILTERNPNGENGENGDESADFVSTSNSSRTALGLIPMGTGSDFARVFGWDTDPIKAVERIVKGETRKIDVGRVVYGKELRERFFINVADLHLSAKAGFYAGQHKKLGNLCYVVGSLQGFQGHQNRDLKVRVDGGEWETMKNVTAICVGNSKYFGGGMKIAPSADPFGGDLEVVTLRDYKWYDFLLQLRKLYQGTHVQQPNVTSVRAHTFDVEEVETDQSYGGTFVQADGEHLGCLNASFSVLPSAIDFIV